MITALLAALAVVSPAPKPRLVVVITVDQLRPDYFERWRPQLKGGLGRLLREGAVFTEAAQDHGVTETAPGHSTVLSGRWPAHTGIISNERGVADRASPLVGAPGPGASPHRFRGTALFDWLKAVSPAARALSVSRKDRGAILPIGRAREHVYWFSAGVFTTSAYYADTLPVWVRAFNARGIPARYAGRPWTLLLPERAYPEADDRPWEDPQGSYGEKTFPHQWHADSGRAARAFPNRPEIDSLTLAFALAGVDALELGRPGATDLLAVSLSATDAVGHLFGPSSREVHDMVLRLDRYLGWFLEQVFRRVGRTNVVVALTADHGVSPYPADLRAQGRAGAAGVSIDTLLRAVNASLPTAATTAGEPVGFRIDPGLVFLSGVAALSAAGVNPDSLVDAVRARIRRVACIARVDRPRDLVSADTARDAVVRRWLHHVPDDAEVALVVTPGPDCVWGDESYAMHGLPTDLDARVPLIFWGSALKRGVYRGRVATVDIAPTLARLLGIVPLERIDGRILSEAFASERLTTP